MKNFKLWMGCLGNGITVCNSAVEEHVDYKHIAHISNNGKIKLYVSESYIPVASAYVRKKYKAHYTPWSSQDGIENKFVAWYYI